MGVGFNNLRYILIPPPGGFNNSYVLTASGCWNNWSVFSFIGKARFIEQNPLQIPCMLLISYTESVVFTQLHAIIISPELASQLNYWKCGRARWWRCSWMESWAKHKKTSCSLLRGLYWRGCPAEWHSKVHPHTNWSLFPVSHVHGWYLGEFCVRGSWNQWNSLFHWNTADDNVFGWTKFYEHWFTILGWPQKWF